MMASFSEAVCFLVCTKNSPYSNRIYYFTCLPQEYGIIQGYEDGTFRPSKTITRQEAMAMIARAMKWTGLNASISGADKLFFKIYASESMRPMNSRIGCRLYKRRHK
ncbi:S-layer homology domain-containing protein [Paenibacillus agricola]|uniref:S-layer homology domain-containing protein n=1 Tax=Paenibacillus agricola TaxID=2716264 RepID=A0ABX0JJI2_9BACL|nr:S-layer homology domain-containing protein [Paenibacillus agricola]NHN34674.1 S-layer homology domain-containing protein [Paenibacillus agricola]